MSCKYTRASLHGSLEVLSKVAFGTFLAYLEECLVRLPGEDAESACFGSYGEDKFLPKCMDRHGVDRVPYRENCKCTRLSLHGSLEVPSKVAFGTFLADREECLVSLPGKDAESAHFRYYGEDKFPP